MILNFTEKWNQKKTELQLMEEVRRKLIWMRFWQSLWKLIVSLLAIALIVAVAKLTWSWL